MYKLYLDTINYDVIKRNINIIDGVTTNPAQFEGEKYTSKSKTLRLIKNYLSIHNKKLFITVMEDGVEKIVNTVREMEEYYNGIPIIPKIMMTKSGLRAVRELKNEIDCAVHLVFSPSQAVLAQRYGAKYIFVLYGRMTDRNIDAVKTIKDVVHSIDMDTDVIVSSIRNVDAVNSVLREEELAEVSLTIPPKVLEDMYNHGLTDEGIKKFRAYL